MIIHLFLLLLMFSVVFALLSFPVLISSTCTVYSHDKWIRVIKKINKKNGNQLDLKKGDKTAFLCSLWGLAQNCHLSLCLFHVASVLSFAIARKVLLVLNLIYLCCTFILIWIRIDVLINTFWPCKPCITAC